MPEKPCFTHSQPAPARTACEQLFALRLDNEPPGASKIALNRAGWRYDANRGEWRSTCNALPLELESYRPRITAHAPLCSQVAEQAVCPAPGGG
ncbi:hypothetical protein [Acetobacter vaccinii]|uniref:Uncharacterized protein n=1 Tax=Acetobacter vaccinii TaxID=2592655 RepID=A0A5C1YSI3_9PROT|nr:hypothetical protein [Acetobacter vaccinii]QEO18773.1 hypothetical protein FLP30_12885 [Acetobacter vaccinii]